MACIRNERIVFAGLDYYLEPGGALILAGANGSGKSSLLRLMAGLGRPAAGRILWNGRPVGDDPEGFAASCQYLGHRDAVKPALTVGENLAFHASLRRRAGRAAIGDALDRMGLLSLADMPARMLSAGQTRRLAFARILATPATLWLLDEPTVALDPPSVSAVMDAIARHRSDGGMIVASTNVPLAIAPADTLDVSGFAGTGTTLWGDAA
ncbi:MAG: heme ABC exporter ATP-binding protein CcmA [Rhodospirillaceae bacterium]